MSVVSAPPDQSLVQRLDALERANTIRTQRSQLKRDIKAGRVRSRDILLHPPVWARQMKIIDLLLATPKWGRQKATKALAQTATSPAKTLGGLSDRQRMALVQQLDRVPLVSDWQRERAARAGERQAA